MLKPGLRNEHSPKKYGSSREYYKNHTNALHNLADKPQWAVFPLVVPWCPRISLNTGQSRKTIPFRWFGEFHVLCTT